MSTEMIDRQGMTLIGIEIQTSNERAHEIGGAWQRFMGEGLAAQIPRRADATIVAVYCEYEGDHTKPYTFFLGCPVAPDTTPPEGMTVRSVPAGRLARFVATGEMPGALMDTWAAIWEAPITRSFEVDYEIHDPAVPNGAEIYISTTE